MRLQPNPVQMRIHNSTLKWEHFAFPLRGFSAQSPCQTSLLAVPSLKPEVFNTWFSVSNAVAWFLTSGRTWATNLRHCPYTCHWHWVLQWGKSNPSQNSWVNQNQLIATVIWCLSDTIYTQLLINNIYDIIKMPLCIGMILLFKEYLYFCFLASIPNKIRVSDPRMRPFQPFIK